MDALLFDLRYGLRSLLRKPEITITAILTLGLGIGACTAIFSVVNTVLLRPLPFDRPDLVVSISGPSENTLSTSTSPANFLDWQRGVEAIEHLAGFRTHNYNLLGNDGPQRLRGGSVSPGFFAIFGVDPLLGRTFQPGEADEEAVVVLSHRIWQGRFGADPGMIGQTIVLNDRSHTVLGVMPPGFHYTSDYDLWVRAYEYGIPAPSFSLGEGWNEIRGLGYFRVVGRLRSDSTIEQADAQISALAIRLREEFPDSNCNDSAGVVSYSEVLTGNIRPALLVLLVAVGLVLLIACANVANLLMARALGRQMEVAVRGALGADRIRLIRQLLTESLLLSTSGGVVGVLLAMWGTNLLVRLSPNTIASFGAISLDLPVLLFCLVASIVTGIVFGLLPAWILSGTELQSSLREGGHRTSESRRRRYFRESLVVVETALSLILLIGAALMIMTLGRLRAVDPGFDPAGVAVARVNVPESRYPENEQISGFFQDVIDRISALPGVESAGAVMALPLSGSAATLTFLIEGIPQPDPGNEPFAEYQVVSTDYFTTMRIPLLAGRFFTALDDSDEDSPGVAIVSEVMADRFFPGEDPIGKRINYGDYDNESSWVTIVGVVGSVRHFNLDLAPEPEVYLHFHQDPWVFMSIVARSSSDPSALLPSMRQAVLAVDPDQPVYSLSTLEEVLDDNLADTRFLSLLLEIFALIAAILAAVGIYGVISYS
ncbi:ABC transporter permease, partial [Candidatus Zixiibacteriota bacterium]